MGKYKYMLNWWRAKDIPQVMEEHDKLDIDKLEFNYMVYPLPSQALDIMKKDGMFDEYDYIIFTSPDLVVKPENLEMLINDIETTDAKVMCGVCNVDLGMWKDRLATSFEVVQGRKYIWEEKGMWKGIHEVKFNGRVLMAVKLDQLGDYKFYKGIDDDPSDLKLCRYFLSKSIPIMCNFDNYMEHLRYTGIMQAGKKTPEIWFKGKQIFTQELPAIPFLPSPVKYK